MVLFAEGDGLAGTGWVTAIVATLSAIGSLVVLLMNTRHRNKQEADQNALKPLQEALDRLQRDIERRDALIENLNQAFEQVFEEHAQCQVCISDLYGSIVLQHDYVKRLAATVRKSGQDPGEIPELPARPARPDRAALEFRAKTLRQQSRSIKESSVVLPQPPQLPPSSNPQGGS